VFRRPSNNSNGNSFDFQGRQLSTEDFNRRVVRWVHGGATGRSTRGQPVASGSCLSIMISLAEPKPHLLPELEERRT
jgi:hypothetical protein